MLKFTHPVLSCKETMSLEESLLGDDEHKTWQAMNRAGRGIGEAIQSDFREIAELPQNARILVLAGKGHNGGDAILAADQIQRSYPLAEVHMLFASGLEGLKPHVQRAWEEIQNVGKTVKCEPEELEGLLSNDFDICIDGLLGMQFAPPLRDPIAGIIKVVNRSDKIRFRCSVDLPSGVGDEEAEGVEPFRADVTYATGTVKEPLFLSKYARSVGRLRYMDIGFFDEVEHDYVSHSLYLRKQCLRKLQGPRPAHSDKRSFGHVFVVGGSTTMPGALLMCVKSALRSGAGLVTACVPESLMVALASQAPEAMWLPCDSSVTGGIGGDSEEYLKAKLDDADAVVFGPGMGRDVETIDLLCSLVAESSVPMVLDADALQTDVVDALSEGDLAGRVVLTPHLGEFARIAGTSPFAVSNDELMKYCWDRGICVLLKGSPTRISDGRRLIYNTSGGPLLARGGSGDVLAGLLGGLLAGGALTLDAACLAACWHGEAADSLARERGQTAVTVMELLEHLSPALRSVI